MTVIELDAHRPHAVGYAICRECGDWWVVVVDCRADFDNLECRECGRMTAELWDKPPAEVIPLAGRKDEGS